MNNNYLAIYDLECTHYIPDLSEPVEIACVIVHPRTLKAVDGGEFHTYVCPPDISAVSKDNIDFHCNAHKKTPDEIKAMWAAAPSQEEAMKLFTMFIQRFHKPGKRKSKFSAPIRCGQNILKYDNIIVDRMCRNFGYVDKENQQSIFHPRDNYDLLNMLWAWFENSDELNSFAMDNLREFFGLSSDGGHTAIQDVKQTGELLVRFLRLHRKLRETYNMGFKNACNESTL